MSAHARYRDIVALFALLLAGGCGLEEDISLQRPAHRVNQPLVLGNDTADPVTWRFGGEAFATQPGATVAVYVDCAEGERLCFETTPEHAFPSMCPPCGRGAVILRATP